MRLGLIGLGRIGALHAETLVGLPGVEKVVVSDPMPAAVQRTAAMLPVETAEDVLKEGVDGVVIAAATAAHAPLVEAAVRAGVPAFCEKPLAPTVAEAVALRELVDDSGVPVQIGFNRRFDPGFAAARGAVLSGVLGRLTTVRSTTLDPAPPPAGYLAGSGGIFRDCAVHDFDIVRFVTGREVVEVYATGSDRADPMFAAAGDVDTAASVLTLDDGTLAVVSNTRYNGRGHDVRLELHGSRDSIAAGWDDRLPLRSVEAGVAFPAGPPHRFFMDRFAAAYRAELAAFAEVVAGTRPSPCTVADALEAAWIAEACTLSLAARRPVRIDEVRGLTAPGRTPPAER